MAKRSSRSLSKKSLPPMRRVMGTEGKRVWLVNGEHIETLREVILKYRTQS